MRPLMNVIALVAMFRRCASRDMRINVTKLSIYFITDSVRGLWIRHCVIAVYFFFLRKYFTFRSFNIVGVRQ